jgi:hypothetical protein
MPNYHSTTARTVLLVPRPPLPCCQPYAWGQREAERGREQCKPLGKRAVSQNHQAALLHCTVQPTLNDVARQRAMCALWQLAWLDFCSMHGACTCCGTHGRLRNCCSAVPLLNMKA